MKLTVLSKRFTQGVAIVSLVAGLGLTVGLIGCGSTDDNDTTPPTTTDPTNPPAVGVDALDPTLVSWDEPAGDVGAWPITAKVVSGSITYDRLTIVRDPPDSWPHVQKEGWAKPSVGNYWVIGKVNGQWHAATFDWAGPGRTGMEAPCFCGGDDAHGPLATWRPVKGETAYLMMSTHARTGVLDNNKQRTNIYEIKMYE
jgi:hypothetical protein